ncbi:MAG: aminodeoxychorismate synthase component I [Thermodesulfobacteriota bacterium]|nr:aminodeoxychorismate synthase component I [Thermodesulfobacteriota bacterium]
MRPLKQTELNALLGALQHEDEYVFLDTVRSDTENTKSFLFLQPEKRLDFLPGDDLAAFVASMEKALADGYYLAGWLSYEFGYLLEPRIAALLPSLIQKKTPLASLGVFSKPLTFDHETGDGSLPFGKSAAELPGFSINNLRLSETKENYLDAVCRLREYIAAGDTYQVNYTLKLLFDFSGSPIAFYENLRRNQSVAYGAMIRLGGEHILSLSPELFFRVSPDSILVRPMKGTMGRGRYLEEDLGFCQILKKDIKNRSENVMIVDLLRNDLARLCHQFGDDKVVTTSLFDVERYESVLQMTSTIYAETGKSVFSKTCLLDFFKALFPCGSVTGAPKIRTMEIIRELEQFPRGVYTGAIGYFTPSGTGTFNVPIRTVRLAGGKGEMGIGSGIVYDSDPEQEWEECLLKGHFLTQPIPEFSLIETIFWEPGKGYWLLDEHLGRLEKSACYFCFSFEKKEVLAVLIQLQDCFGGQCSRVRLTLSKDGCMETTFQSCDAPIFRTLPKNPAGEHADLPGISLSESSVDSSSPWYFHKTTHRDLFQKEFAGAQQQGLFDICFVNDRQELTEGCISNLILFIDGCFFTPPVASGLLGGTLRKKLLSEKSPLLSEKIMAREDLFKADALFCCNSVRGVVQVRIISQ